MSGKNNTIIKIKEVKVETSETNNWEVKLRM